MARTLSNRDWALFVLRLAIGAIFLYNGTQKWIFWDGIPESIPQALGIVLLILSVAEPLGAIALISGIFVPAASLGFITVMVGALILNVMNQQPFDSWDLELLLLASSLVVLIEGPGNLAVAPGSASRSRAPARPAASQTVVVKPKTKTKAKAKTTVKRKKK